MILNRRYDRTLYTDDQVAFAQDAAALVSGVWSTKIGTGVSIVPATEDDCAPLGKAYALVMGDKTWMTTLPPDLIDHRPVSTATGDFLCTGLGLGVAVLLANANPAVTTITVIESDQRVIAMVEPLLRPKITKPFAIIRADAEVFAPLPLNMSAVVPLLKWTWCWLDHSNDMVPSTTKARYATFCTTVKSWYEERERLKTEWRAAARAAQTKG